MLSIDNSIPYGDNNIVLITTTALDHRPIKKHVYALDSTAVITTNTFFYYYYYLIIRKRNTCK